MARPLLRSVRCVRNGFDIGCTVGYGTAPLHRDLSGQLAKRFEEIVVAKSSTGPAQVLAFLSVGIVVGRTWTIQWPVRFALVAFTFGVAYLLLSKLAGMKLSVSQKAVHVVNFNSRFELDINTVRIEDQKNPEAWPHDDIIEVNPEPKDELQQLEEKKARALILTDASGVKAPVGVAPSYGSRLDEIAEDLYIAIDRMRP